MGNSGDLLKAVGVGYAVIMCIFSIIAGAIFMTEKFFLGLMLLVVGVVNGGIMGTFIYAFGEITECVSNISYRNAEILRTLNKFSGQTNEKERLTKPTKPTTVEHVGLTKKAVMAKNGDSWICHGCGENNSALDLTCRNCGKYK